MRISHVVGARPNFVKAAPVIRALEAYEEVTQRIVHTGQHYDPAMSDNIMRDVGMREPDINLAIGSGSHADQTARALVALESDFITHKPDMVVVYGDVNSTLAGALAASKLHIPIAHVEAGLRSFDRTMPEEVNRILVDSISNLLFVTSEDAIENLEKEGIPKDQVFFVGNTMIDSIEYTRTRWASLAPNAEPGGDNPFVLVTLHRPSNVDDSDRLEALVSELRRISESLPVVFPVHPRTRVKFEQAGLAATERLRLVDPLPYLESIALISRAAVVITDSGGVQEEASHLGTPCLTVRASTERPVTMTIGTNRLVTANRLAEEVAFERKKQRRTAGSLTLWDGVASVRLAQALLGENGSARLLKEKTHGFVESPNLVNERASLPVANQPVGDRAR